MAASRDQTFELRRALERDANAITALVDAAYTHWKPVLGRTPLPMLADYRRALTEHRFDLLESDGDLAALIETVLRDSDLLIVNVAVHPDHQGHGLGRQLLDHAIKLARDEQRTEVRLYTANEMQSNLDLYFRYGFEIEREEPFKNGALIHFVMKV